MEQGKVDIPGLIGIAIVYILLSLFGCFVQMQAALFPVLALPFALYVVKRKPPVLVQVIFHIALGLFNGMLSLQPVAAMLTYGISVAATAYIILYFYERQLALPQIIMGTAAGLSVAALLYFSAMKMMGMDFKQIYEESLNSLMTTNNMGSSEGINSLMNQEYAKLINGSSFNMNEMIESLKNYYACMMLISLITMSAITVILFCLLVRGENRGFISIKQLMEFRMSKAAMVVFVGAFVAASMMNSDQSVSAVLQTNILLIFAWLFWIAGMFGVMGLLHRSSINGTLKVLGYIGILFCSGPFIYLLIIFGCLDALFNFRKVEIVV